MGSSGKNAAPGSRSRTALANGAKPPERKKAAKPKLTNARLRRLAKKYRPPQSWYDEQQSVT